MKIALAQLKPVKGNIAANIERHERATHLAIAHKADAIFFPELSITGYEPELAASLATTQHDPRFDSFQRISDTSALTIGLGVPTRTISGIQISLLIFQAGQPRQTYSKQQLHPDELPYFVAGNAQLIVNSGNGSIAPAICYESLQKDHAQTAHQLGAGIYVASVAKSQTGVAKAMAHYPRIAAQLAMPVLMSNCVGDCDTFVSAGQSAVWTRNGKLAGQLDDVGEGLLLFDTDTEVVSKQRL
ncbi:carbon-nitrogen hydrolase family protein [uncultured Spirosoma sp.]|uniref:carbon-nitrogen hydrolase family protein n=1 Tax=uncultured Spirosoma sp. TaxID=278208 RepID=UPI0025879823|nr:carbon-nitrogen hydrolase family protein [uncultured Spirosoma sp.]